MATEPPFVTRVAIENYKSIAHCDVRLGPLTFLVGRNGSGKSNFLDALRFVADALRGGLDAALRTRGNVDDLRQRDAAPDAPIGLQFDLALPGAALGHYTLRLAQRPFGGFAIAEEQCTIEYPATGHPPAGFHIRDGRSLHNPSDARQIPTDRLYLATSPMPDDRTVYDVLANMAFYQPSPAHMRGPQPHDPGNLLLSDGSNVASVVLRLAQQQPAALQRITDDLHAVLPTLLAIGAVPIGGYDALQFYQQRDDDPLRFYQQNGATLPERPFTAASMSEGTLHMLGVLVALFQGGFGEEHRPTVIGIEEPEATLHPAATAVLLDALREASLSAQVLVSTQSLDVLDNREVEADWLLAVASQGGVSRIGPIGEGQRSILRDARHTAGTLLRTGDFRPVFSSEAEGTARG